VQGVKIGIIKLAFSIKSGGGDGPRDLIGTDGLKERTTVCSLTPYASR
jgi:hypothetical protein